MRSGTSGPSNADAMIADLLSAKPRHPNRHSGPQVLTSTPSAFISQPFAAVQPNQAPPSHAYPNSVTSSNPSPGNPLGIQPSRIPKDYWDALRRCGGSESAYPNTQAVYALLLSSGLSQETLSAIWAMVNTSFPCLLTQAEFFAALALVAQLQAGRPPSIASLQGPYPIPKLGSLATHQSSSNSQHRLSFQPTLQSNTHNLSAPSHQQTTQASFLNEPQPKLLNNHHQPFQSSALGNSALSSNISSQPSQVSFAHTQSPASLQTTQVQSSDSANSVLNLSDEFGDFQAPPTVVEQTTQQTNVFSDNLRGSMTPLQPSQESSPIHNPPNSISYDALKDLQLRDEPDSKDQSPDTLSLRSEGKDTTSGFEFSSPMLDEQDPYAALRESIVESGELNQTSSEENFQSRAWCRVLESAMRLFEQAQSILSEAAIDIREEAMASKAGQTYSKGLLESWIVSRRILDAAEHWSEDLRGLERMVESRWKSLVVLTSLNTAPKSLQHLPLPDTPSDELCGLCLLRVQEQRLNHAGAHYHPSCANFWLNLVEPCLPGLKPRLRSAVGPALPFDLP